ncbi:MAG: alpha-mannosidase, partial [Armatimonadota bacterium]
MNPKDVAVYMIGNAHIDPVWLWRWQEGFAEVLATCRSALDRMNEFPEFVFTRADAATYKWIEDACPDMFDEIRRRVQEGRWSVVGGWWEQADCNIPCGESFVRHALYGKRYFLEKFGIDVDIGYNVDSFGHNAGLPQILAKAGIKYYVFMRPNPAENPEAATFFWWQGPDGSRVLAHRLQEPYCTGPSEIVEHIKACAENRLSGSSVTSCFYGVGNHGGGPTIANIESIRRLQQDPEAPTLVFATLRQMFDHAQEEGLEFPVVQGDLQRHAVGCYSAHSAMKMWNRRAENALIASEKLCALAKLDCGRPFPKNEFASAWQKLLFCQFHDILAGTSLESAYEDVRNWIGAALDTADYQCVSAISRIASEIETRGEGHPFVVFNPHGHEVKCAIYFDQSFTSLRDHTGRRVPVQTVEPVFEHTGPRPKKLFVDTLPALGYRL